MRWRRDRRPPGRVARRRGPRPSVPDTRRDAAPRGSLPCDERAARRPSRSAYAMESIRPVQEYFLGLRIRAGVLPSGQGSTGLTGAERLLDLADLARRLAAFLSTMIRTETMPAAAATERLGLPVGIRACLFDLDGVLTPTALVHAAAWKQMFDAFLRERAARTGEQFQPFDAHADYEQYVDGEPRYDGVRSFLAARGIELPEGTRADSPSEE